MGNDDVTSTRLAAMEHEHLRLETQWRAIGADLATVADGRALVLPRALAEAIEAVPTSPAAAPHATHIVRA